MCLTEIVLLPHHLQLSFFLFIHKSCNGVSVKFAILRENLKSCKIVVHLHNVNYMCILKLALIHCTVIVVIVPDSTYISATACCASLCALCLPSANLTYYQSA